MPAAVRKYHEWFDMPLMVSLAFALQRAENTMKNTIDDADYIMNWILFIHFFQ